MNVSMWKISFVFCKLYGFVHFLDQQDCSGLWVASFIAMGDCHFRDGVNLFIIQQEGVIVFHHSGDHHIFFGMDGLKKANVFPKHFSGNYFYCSQ